MTSLASAIGSPSSVQQIYLHSFCVLGTGLGAFSPAQQWTKWSPCYHGVHFQGGKIKLKENKYITSQRQIKAGQGLASNRRCWNWQPRRWCYLSQSGCEVTGQYHCILGAWSAWWLPSSHTSVPPAGCCQPILASIARNGAPSPFSVCDGICEGGRERERDRIRGWWPREIMWIFYHQINSTSLNYQRASHHSLFSRGQGKLFIIQHEMK